MSFFDKALDSLPGALFEARYIAIASYFDKALDSLPSVLLETCYTAVTGFLF